MTELEKARQLIDEADREIARQFEKRMAAVKSVAGYKSAHGLPVFDASREKAVIEKNTANIQDSALKGFYASFQQSLMDVSKRYQESLLSGVRAAFCGTEGAFAYTAVKKIFPYGRPVAFGSFEGAYNAVAEGECECCVLPLENSFAGEVGQVIDLIYDGQLYVNGIYSLPVKQNLIGVKGASVSDIKTVISHPQALMQCDGYIKEHGFDAQQSANTAFAAEKVASMGDKSVAAIAGAEAAEKFGLAILDKNINESAANTTRFAVLSASPVSAGREDGLILIFTVNDEVGALAKAVNIICAHGFNMRVLRSRPVKNVPWQYYFYVEASGEQNGTDELKMLNELSVCCEKLKVAGRYSADRTI